MIDAWSGAKFNSIAFNASNAARRVFLWHWVRVEIDALRKNSIVVSIEMVWNVISIGFRVIVFAVEKNLQGVLQIWVTFVSIHNVP